MSPIIDNAPSQQLTAAKTFGITLNQTQLIKLEGGRGVGNSHSVRKFYNLHIPFQLSLCASTWTTNLNLLQV